MKLTILTLILLINFNPLFGQNNKVNVGFSKDKLIYQLGDRGPIVKEIQKCIGFPVKYQTGIWDQRTEKKMQELYGGGINEYTYNRIKENFKAYSAAITTTKSTKNEGVHNLYKDAVTIDAFDLFETKHFIYNGAPFNGSVFFVNDFLFFGYSKSHVFLEFVS